MLATIFANILLPQVDHLFTISPSWVHCKHLTSQPVWLVRCMWAVCFPRCSTRLNMACHGLYPKITIHSMNNSINTIYPCRRQAILVMALVMTHLVDILIARTIILCRNGFKVRHHKTRTKFYIFNYFLFVLFILTGNEPYKCVYMSTFIVLNLQ